MTDRAQPGVDRGAARLTVSGLDAFYGDSQVLHGVELEIRPSALSAIARKALARKTGARGLRSILEFALIDTMFDLPNLDGVAKVVVDEHIVEEGSKPLLVYREPAKTKASA